jgi:hypothetical protein
MCMRVCACARQALSDCIDLRRCLRRITFEIRRCRPTQQKQYKKIILIGMQNENVYIIVIQLV